VNRLVGRHVELLKQALGVRFIPIRAEQRCRAQEALNRERAEIRPAGELAGEVELGQSRGILPNRRAAIGDGAGRGQILAGQKAEQRRLARAVAADQAVDAPGFEREIEIFQNRLFTIVFAQPLSGQHPGRVGLDRFHHKFSSSTWFSARLYSSSRVMPRRFASRTRSRTVVRAKASRRFLRRACKAPGATNIPTPRRLYSSPSSTRRLTPLAAVAGLMLKA